MPEYIILLNPPMLFEVFCVITFFIYDEDFASDKHTLRFSFGIGNALAQGF